MQADSVSGEGFLVHGPSCSCALKLQEVSPPIDGPTEGGLSLPLQGNCGAMVSPHFPTNCIAHTLAGLVPVYYSLVVLEVSWTDVLLFGRSVDLLMMLLLV